MRAKASQILRCGLISDQQLKTQLHRATRRTLIASETLLTEGRLFWSPNYSVLTNGTNF